jgi:hypothetical protein
MHTPEEGVGKLGWGESCRPTGWLVPAQTPSSGVRRREVGGKRRTGGGDG